MRDRIGRYASALLVSAIAALCGFARQGVDARTAEALLIVFSEGSHIGQDPAESLARRTSRLLTRQGRQAD